MPDADALPRASELVRQLRARAFRCGVGILRLQPDHLGHETGLAARLGVEPHDYAKTLLAELPAASRYVPLTADTERDRLSRIAEARGEFDCALVYNLDLALAKLPLAERARLWHALRLNLPHRTRALLLALPYGADHLLPDTEALTHWQEEGRLVRSDHL